MGDDRHSAAVARLVQEFCKLPGIGPKSAERLAFFLLAGDRRVALDLADALKGVVEAVKACEECGNYSEGPLCPVSCPGRPAGPAGQPRPGEVDRGRPAPPRAAWRGRRGDPGDQPDFGRRRNRLVRVERAGRDGSANDAIGTRFAVGSVARTRQHANVERRSGRPSGILNPSRPRHAERAGSNP
jgi:hypothetical protein